MEKSGAIFSDYTTKKNRLVSDYATAKEKPRPLRTHRGGTPQIGEHGASRLRTQCSAQWVFKI
jgi:hypothetical protein